MNSSPTPDRQADASPGDSQADIADKVQKGIRTSNEREQHAGTSATRKPQLDSPAGKATQFDGNPNPQGDDETGVLKPHDDTPAVLRKRSGPRDDQT